MRAIVYTRVSTREQGDRGFGLQAQRAKIDAELGRRGWEAVLSYSDVASTGAKYRPKLDEAIAVLDAGGADALVVARLDRLSRSVGEFAALMDHAHKHRWAIVVLDPAVDLTTPFGRALAGVAATFAQLERELISARTKEGLEQALRKHGQWRERPYANREIVERIVALRSEGLSYTKIAAILTTQGIPTPRGAAAWNHRTVSIIYKREGDRANAA